jgi:hypothetical protein
MTLALSGICASGLLVSKLLLELGLRSILERYVVAVWYIVSDLLSADSNLAIVDSSFLPA